MGSSKVSDTKHSIRGHERQEGSDRDVGSSEKHSNGSISYRRSFPTEQKRSKESLLYPYERVRKILNGPFLPLHTHILHVNKSHYFRFPSRVNLEFLVHGQTIL